jgi:hypothetical protein
MALSSEAQDQQFALAHSAWRQFHGLCIDPPAPSQPEIDARLQRYQKAHETAALRDFAAAALMLGALGKVLVDGMRVFLSALSATEVLVFLLTCGLLVIVGVHTLTRLRRAVEHRALAQRIGTETVPWSKVESLFAGVADAIVRDYIDEVRRQGRPLRRAETAVLIERGRGRRPIDEASAAAFRHAVRGRTGPSSVELATVSLCLLAGLSAKLPSVDPATLVPAIWLGAVATLAGLGHTVVQLGLDPWGLSGGGHHARALRWMLAGDVVPQIAVFLVAAATATMIATLGH